MNKLLERKLQTDFPYLFEEMYSKNGGLAYGVQSLDGWFDVIYELCKCIRDEKDDSCRVTSIKEKFGTLRFNISGGTDIIYEMIATAERISEHTCEMCGKEGKLRNIHCWLKTLCDECTTRRWQTPLDHEDHGML